MKDTYKRIVLNEPLEGITGVAMKYECDIIIVINQDEPNQHIIEETLVKKLLSSESNMVVI